MKYKIEKQKKSRKQVQEKLVQLYLGCSSIEEFCIKQKTVLPEASRNDVRACKLFYFKKMHPVAWALAFIGTSCGSCAGAFACASLNLIRIPGCEILFGFLGILLSIAAFCVHWALHGDMMQTLKWHEAGCPKDY